MSVRYRVVVLGATFGLYAGCGGKAVSAASDSDAEPTANTMTEAPEPDEAGEGDPLPTEQPTFPTTQEHGLSESELIAQVLERQAPLPQRFCF